MALVSLGTQTVDWTTKNEVVYGTAAARRDSAVAFVIRQGGTPVQTRNQYVGVLGLLDSSYGLLETPLISKYFPGVRAQLLLLCIPDADYDRDFPVSLVLLPREFKPGSRTNDTLQIEVLYDDELIRDGVPPIA